MIIHHTTPYQYRRCATDSRKLIFDRGVATVFYGKSSPFSNLNDDFGDFNIRVGLMTQPLLDILGYDMLKSAAEARSLPSIEYGLQFFKLLVHGELVKAHALLGLPNVFDAMRVAKAKLPRPPRLETTTT